MNSVFSARSFLAIGRGKKNTPHPAGCKTAFSARDRGNYHPSNTFLIPPNLTKRPAECLKPPIFTNRLIFWNWGLRWIQTSEISRRMVSPGKHPIYFGYLELVQAVPCCTSTILQKFLDHLQTHFRIIFGLRPAKLFSARPSSHASQSNFFGGWV